MTEPTLPVPRDVQSDPGSPEPTPARPDALARARAALEILVVTLGVEVIVSSAALPFLDAGAGIEALGAAGLCALVILKNLLVPGALIVLFLRAGGGSLRDLGFARRNPGGEALLGLVCFLPMTLTAGLVVQVAVRLVPRLHDVEGNPLLDLIHGPADAAWFLLAGTLAGGLGEETVRAFVLSRFQRYLGGMAVGLVIWSVAFGLLHLVQGMDKALAVGVLGLLLGLLYAWRRDPVASIVAHAAFNCFQTLMAWFSAG